LPAALSGVRIKRLQLWQLNSMGIERPIYEELEK